MFCNDLDGKILLERLEAVQIAQAWDDAERQRRDSFLGSLDWERRGQRDYLYRRIGRTTRSLGPRSAETEAQHAAFARGQAENAERLRSAVQQLERQAAILRALGAGRLPVIAARILRQIEVHRPGMRPPILGTDALFVYEALADIAFSPHTAATADIGKRNRLRLAVDARAIPGLQRLVASKVDGSFKPGRAGDNRLTNKSGYTVDFVAVDSAEIAGPVGGLRWLLGAPAVEAAVIDLRGFPVTVRSPDPRFWTVHKVWLAQRGDRPADRRRRDRAQASLMKRLLAERLPQFPLDDAFLRALPGPLRLDLLPDAVSGSLTPYR